MKKWFWFVLSGFIILMDQMSKLWITHHLKPFDSLPILPFLNFSLAYNTGAAFSFLSNTGNWHSLFFIGFSLTMSCLIIYWIIRLKETYQLQLAGLSFILGGALGNLLDRLWWGHVIDFIDVYYLSYHWYVFNLADSAICIGAGLLFIDLVKSKQCERHST